jgi:hypothetical protein
MRSSHRSALSVAECVERLRGITRSFGTVRFDRSLMGRVTASNFLLTKLRGVTALTQPFAAGDLASESTGTRIDIRVGMPIYLLALLALFVSIALAFTVAAIARSAGFALGMLLFLFVAASASYPLLFWRREADWLASTILAACEIDAVGE